MNWSELVKEHRDILDASEPLGNRIHDVVDVIKKILDGHGKVILCGNGGSFAHSQHFAAELVVRYRKTREPMRAIALGSNPAILTAICNDLNAVDLFVREFAAVANPNDCLVAFSTSGASPNVLKTIELARGVRLPTIGITGIHGMGSLVDHEIRVPSDKTSIIQQVHTLIIHAICEMLDA